MRASFEFIIHWPPHPSIPMMIAKKAVPQHHIPTLQLLETCAKMQSAACGDLPATLPAQAWESCRPPLLRYSNSLCRESWRNSVFVDPGPHSEKAAELCKGKERQRNLGE